MKRNELLTAIVILLLVGLIILLLSDRNKRNQDYQQYMQLYEVEKDSLRKHYNELNQAVYTISSYQSDPQMFLDALLSDEFSKELQEIVSKNIDKLNSGGSVTLIEGGSEVSVSTETEIETTNDPFFPIYQSQFENEWLKYNIIASKDSTSFQGKFTNKYNITIGFQKDQDLPMLKRWLSSPKPYVRVTEYNPYSYTSQARTFITNDKKLGRWGIGLSVGYGLSATNGGVMNHGVIIGVTTNYSLIRF